MVFYDLIMWKDVAKSSLWFGLGSLCFLSSCFAKGMTFRCVSLVFTPCVSNIHFVVSLRYLNVLFFMFLKHFLCYFATGTSGSGCIFLLEFDMPKVHASIVSAQKYVHVPVHKNHVF